jgi:hypothetical protein
VGDVWKGVEGMVGWNGIVMRGLFTWDGYSMAFLALMRFLPYEHNMSTIHKQHSVREHSLRLH